MDSLTILQRLGGGHFIDELAYHLTRVSEEVVTSGNKGTVTVAFSIAQAQRNEPTVIIDEKFSERPPSPETKGAMFYAVGDGMLHKEDPRQTRMEFRVVEDAQGVRTLDDQMNVKEAE
jgi:hypothetical protein